MFKKSLLSISLFTLSILTSFSFASYKYTWLNYALENNHLSGGQLHNFNPATLGAVGGTVNPLNPNTMNYAAANASYFNTVPAKYRTRQNIGSTFPRQSRSIVFAYSGSFSNYVAYPYRLTDGTIKMYELAIPTNSFLGFLWRGIPGNFSYIVPQNWGFAMYDFVESDIGDYTKNYTIKISQFSNGKVYDGYYMSIENTSVYLFDFKRNLVFVYNNVGDSKYLLQDYMGGSFIDNLRSTTGALSSVYRFTYTAKPSYHLGGYQLPQNNLFPRPYAGNATPLNYDDGTFGTYSFGGVQIYISGALTIQTPEFYDNNLIPIEPIYETPTQKENYTQCLEFADGVKELATRLSACKTITHFDLPMTWTGDDERSWIYNTLDITDPYDFSGVASSFVSPSCIDTYDHIKTYYDYYIGDYLTGSSGDQIGNLSFEQKFYDYYILARKNHTNPSSFDPLTYCQNNLWDPAANVPDKQIVDGYSSALNYLKNINSTISATLNGSTGSIVDDQLGENSIIQSFLDKIQSPFNQNENFFNRSSLTCETTEKPPFGFIIFIPFILLNLFIFKLFHK